MLDFKGEDSLNFLEGSDFFFRYMECFDGLDRFYQRFLDRQSGKDKTRTPIFLYFDELAAAVNASEKKEAELLKKKIANLLMLGRSFNVFCILSLQRPDAAYISARFNIQLVVALHNLDASGKEMFFNEVKDEMQNDRKRGTGYMLEGGANLYKVVVQSVNDMDKLHQTILDKLSSQKL
ncbi:MAG: hypothetical protein IKB01_10940 [Lachnospiraceae bacterium]|nr:hypothetical protein [Lachnospiraceae bacterium]